MGTRASVRLSDDYGDLIATLYVQFDGDPKGFGLELASFLEGIEITDGVVNRPNTANGMLCLAAQIVAHFKNGSGTYYLMRADVEPSDEEYEYCVSRNGDDIVIVLYALGFEEYLDGGWDYLRRYMFGGKASEFKKRIEELK